MHIDIPLSIMKLKTAMIRPNSARKTQSSPNLANVCLHRNDIAFANLPIKVEKSNYSLTKLKSIDSKKAFESVNQDKRLALNDVA